WAAIVFFALWVLLVPLVSMFPSVVIGSGGWARRLSLGGPIIVCMGYYPVMQLVGVASLFMPPVYDFSTEIGRASCRDRLHCAHLPTGLRRRLDHASV